MDRDQIRQKLGHNGTRLLSVIKWTVFSHLLGLFLGVLGAGFYHGIAWVTKLRLAHPQFLLLLPAGAVLIRFLYRLLHYEEDGGTNLVLSAIHATDDIPLKMAPLIFISTILSHLAGASVGREGAALQFGGSIGNFVGKLFHFNETDKKTMIMVGMSAVFSALFGTPIGAAVFSMEVVSVGIMHYAALMPCAIASLVARQVAAKLGAPNAAFSIGTIPEFTADGAWRIVIVGICCELFGFAGAPYYLLAIAFSYLLSGYYGLYTSQTIVYSKYRSNYINKETH